MKYSDIEVGQIVYHNYRHFIGVVQGKYRDVLGECVEIEIIKDAGMLHKKGETYTAIPSCLEYIASDRYRPVGDEHLKLIEEIEMLTIKVAELEDELAEQVEENESLSANSVFKAELGNGIKFHGTKQDYRAFVEGITLFAELVK